MKSILTTSLALLIAAYAAAQCNDFYVLKDGSSWTYENFNGKRKSTGKTEQKVTAYQNIADGYKAKLHMIMYNEKGKQLTEADVDVSCEKGTFIMDMRRFLPQEQQKAFDSYELKFETENLELPSKLSAGQTLKNGSIVMTAVGSPLPMKITVNITDRKVQGKESITTPAGTFECWKITSRSATQMQMGFNMNLNFTTTEWIAEKAGMVKSESYDKNGSLSSYTVLVSRQ